MTDMKIQSDSATILIRIFSFNPEVCFYCTQRLVLFLNVRLECWGVNDKISPDSWTRI